MTTTRLSMVAMSGLAVALATAPARSWSQCAFDEAAKAKGAKFAFVRAYPACPGVTFLAPNTATNAGVPGCTPPAPLSQFRFGPKGTCALKTSAKLEDPCSTGTGYPCSNLSIKAKCRGIEDGSGNLVDGLGWNLRLLTRRTVEDLSNGDMTAIDSILEFSFGAASKGTLELSTNTNSLFGTIICFPLACSFPPCTSIEIMSAAIVDPSSKVFATLGSSTR